MITIGRTMKKMNLRLVIVLLTSHFLGIAHIYGQIPSLSVEETMNFKKISNESLKAPYDVSATPYHLAIYLTRHANNDLEKVRSIYVWTANNIVYDMKAFKQGQYPDFHARAVLKERKALCEGYSRLVNELCTEAGIQSELIRGYSKGYGYEPGDSFAMSNHSWNAVKINGEWFLLDATWAATKTNVSRLKKPINDHYFLTDPREFLIDHLPEIELWQLVSNPVSLEEFEAGEAAVRQKVEHQGAYHVKDSLAKFLAMNASNRTIEYQKRASIFNPKNTAANYHLGVEYLFRGLDSLEILYNIKDAEVETAIPVLEERVFKLFQEAAFHFSGIRPSNAYYESAQNFLDETIYQRGVFKYETAIQLIDIYRAFTPQHKKEFYKRYERLVNQYFYESRTYFLEIPFDSWYYKNATDYIKFYLDKEFAEL